jgi:transposase-like protein
MIWEGSMQEAKGEIEKLFQSEESARAYLERQRWQGNATCHRCQSPKVRRLPDKHRRIGFWQCNGCRRQFSVRTNSIFQHSNIPLSKWLRLFNLFSVASKKGKSSTEISRLLGVKQETAWFMGHRIRAAMSSGKYDALLRAS